MDGGIVVLGKKCIHVKIGLKLAGNLCISLCH